MQSVIIVSFPQRFLQKSHWISVQEPLAANEQQKMSPVMWMIQHLHIFVSHLCSLCYKKKVSGLAAGVINGVWLWFGLLIRWGRRAKIAQKNYLLKNVLFTFGHSSHFQQKQDLWRTMSVCRSLDNSVLSHTLDQIMMLYLDDHFSLFCGLPDI